MAWDAHKRRHSPARRLASPHGLHKCFNQALQLGDFRPHSLQSVPDTKRLTSLHQGEGLVGYLVLPDQRRAHGWSQQPAT